ncbi:MAG: heme transporter, partial [Myxococcota bacterium]|nr:heme transporter [Myxococcota bacterium]
DPRLTTTLLAGLIFVAVVALRSMGSAGEAERRFAAALALLGVLDLPLIHWSVQKWRGLHPTVITGAGGGLDPAMRTTLLACFAAFSLLVAWLLWVRARAESLRARADALEAEAARRGVLEEAA